MARYQDILELVGGTPVVRLRKLAPKHVELYVKIEAFNPMGSVKDRLALGVIEEAERSGKLKPGQTVVEATSGNTGIGLAMVCASKGYPLVIVMSESFSLERRKLMRFLGAKVVLTPAAAKGSGMSAKARELADAHGWYCTEQFSNEANADMHSRTTAREILADFADTRLDYFVTGVGTGGTLKGVARVLKQERPETQIVVCEPDNVPMLASGVPQPAAGSHPLFRPHVMQGWQPDVISKLTQDAVAAGYADRFVGVDGGEALRLARELARQEGIFVGITAGATLSAAIQVAEGAAPGSVLCCMLPDTGERYLSTPLFAEVAEAMNEDELAIARSTPNWRFDVPLPKAPKLDDAAVVADESSTTFVREVLADAQQPIVMFAFQWCEFCWAVRKLFSHCRVPYRSVDLDSVALQEGNRGGKIRAAVQERTNVTTIPQVFVAGDLIGGATDVLHAWKDGKLQPRLAALGLSFDDPTGLDPYSFLPNWKRST